MHGPTLTVTTQLFGLGAARQTAPLSVMLPSHVVLPLELVAAHVQAEIERAQQLRDTSLALHYLLADDLRVEPVARAIDPAEEVQRAMIGLAERRYLLVVDGAAIMDLDAPLSLTSASQVTFVRLLPLIGG